MIDNIFDNISDLTLLNPTKEGYDFLGWYIGENKIETIPAGITEDMILEARWGNHVHKFEKDFDGNDLIVWAKEPTCTMDGYGIKYCSICNSKVDYAQSKLEHDFIKENGVVKMDWIREPTCEMWGTGIAKCSRCNESFEIDADPLGHSFEQIGSSFDSFGNKIYNSVYKCNNPECGTVAMELLPRDATEESKDTFNIVKDIDGEEYAKLRYMTIGCTYLLDESISDIDPEDAYLDFYNKDFKGSYFEFEMNLSEEMANQLQNCRLYCDVEPSTNYSQEDFFLSNDNFISRGMYIDDSPEHQPTIDDKGNIRGVEVADAKYVLYVDGECKKLDTTIKNPIPVYNRRGEYVLPYTFNLHEGINTFSIHFAGGFSGSRFYKFTFRNASYGMPKHSKISFQEATIENIYNKPYLKIGGESIATIKEIESDIPYIRFISKQENGDYIYGGSVNCDNYNWEIDNDEIFKAYLIMDISALEINKEYEAFITVFRDYTETIMYGYPIYQNVFIEEGYDDFVKEFTIGNKTYELYTENFENTSFKVLMIKVKSAY